MVAYQIYTVYLTLNSHHFDGVVLLRQNFWQITQKTKAFKIFCAMEVSIVSSTSRSLTLIMMLKIM